MTNTLRKIAVTITIPALCGLIAWNAYGVARSLKLIEKHAADRAEAAQTQADVGRVWADLQDMETGQRGYLLTGDDSYLQPYNAANDRLETDFGRLHARLAGKPAAERALETQVRAVAEAKVAEMKETVHLREQGYRHRAFLIVGSNRGKQLMDEVRAKLDALSSAQTSDVARYDGELRESVAKAVRGSALASGILLALTVLALLALNLFTARLEIRHARQARELQATGVRLEQFTSTIFCDVRALALEMRSHAESLLAVDGGFLPRQGQHKAERIEGNADRMIGMLDALSRDGEATNVRPLEKLSA